MAGSGRKLADEVLAGHIAAGLPHAQAAEKAGVSERTVRRRLNDPKFQKLVEKLKSEAVGRAVNILGLTMSGAAVELAKLLRSAEEKTRLHAAKAIIELGMKARQHADLERRLNEVESMLQGDGTGESYSAIDETAEAGAMPAPSRQSDA